MRKKDKKKYLYIVVEWGSEPKTFVTKLDLANHLGQKNPRLVNGWFKDNWFHIIDGNILVKVEIPKVKSKVRR